jgi:hypothetical protein
MEVEFCLIPEDFVALSEYQFGQEVRRNFSLNLALVFLVVVLAILAIVASVKVAGIGVGLVGFALAIFLTVIQFPKRHQFAARKVKKILDQGKNAKLLEPRKLRISPEGISYSSVDSAAMTMWSAVEKIAVTKDHAFFYMTTTAADILPRRAFAHDHDFTDFVETAQHYFEAANKEPQPA